MPKETFHCSCEVHFRTNFSISRRVNKIDTGDPVASRAPTLWIIQISCTLSALTCTQPECWTYALIPNDNTLFWMSPPKSPNLRKKMLEGREEYDLIFMKCIHEIQFTETLPSKPVPTNQPHIKTTYQTWDYVQSYCLSATPTWRIPTDNIKEYMSRNLDNNICNMTTWRHVKILINNRHV